MAAARVDTTTPTRPGGGAVIRPLYGVFIRDNLAKFRNDIQGTITTTKQAIAKGTMKGPEVAGDGILQGKELTKAKAAVKDLAKALKALKPVAGAPVGAQPTTSSRASGAGRITPLYGVVFRDDLSRFRDQITKVMADIKKGMTSLQPKEKAEAKVALTSLQAALKDLGAARGAWN